MDAATVLGQMFGGFPQALIAGMGAALLVLTVGLARRTLRVTRGHVTLGRIVRYVENRDSESATTYAPIFRFRPGAAREIEVQSQTRFDREPDGIGDVVEVRYDEEHPDRADITAASRQWLAVAVVMLLGFGSLYTAWVIGAG
ncbi:DUF3592 domain-containing protein [Altererythrobacter aquiaggeris]|uniref:DUF3592 domain-containing protein n=1 Tax=Aestuarierythrobacter aquiaggeris TaxID=1898396 RepID=UPI003015997B